MKALPRADSDEGTAVAEGVEDSETNVRPVAARLIRVVPQARFWMEPRGPEVLVAAAAVNPVEPKSASGRVWQLAELEHTDGASRIHSADVVSTTDGCRRLVNERWR